MSPPPPGPTRPPRLAAAIVRLLLPQRVRDPLLGDLAEEHRQRSRPHGWRDRLGADLWYWKQLLRVRPLALRREVGRVERRGPRHDRRESHRMDRILQDIRYGARMLRSYPLFTAVAALTLAIGIGANTAIFTLVNAVLLRPLPFEDPERVVVVYTSDYSSSLYGASSYPDYLDLRELDAFEGLAAVRGGLPVQVEIDGEGRRLPATVTTANYFSVLGVRAAAGRVFGADEEAAPGAAPAVVISHALWQELGGDDSVLGRILTVNATAYTVVGVAPAGFRGTDLLAETALWIPMSMLGEVRRAYVERGLLEQRGARWLGTVGRLAAGVTLEQARERVAALAAGLAERHPDTNLGTLRQPDRPRPMSVVPARTAVVGPDDQDLARRIAVLLLTVVGFVLLLACANVAHLLLSRGVRRQHEMAVRQALGAGRSRLVRQLLTESVLLALLGGGLGLLLAATLNRLMASVDLPLGIALPDLSIRGDVLTFCLVLSLATGVLFGVVPAFRATGGRLASSLRDRDRRGKQGRLSPGNLLVVGQVAVSLVLLVGAGLFLRSLQETLDVELGFDTEGVLLGEVDLTVQGYDPGRGTQLYADLREALATLPGVRASAVAAVVPVDPGGSRMTMEVEGHAPDEREDMELNFNVVTPGYFEALGIEVVRGRVFQESDTAEAARVAVVNEAFVRRFWPDGRALGRTVGQPAPDVSLPRVVGVVRDGRYRSVRETPYPYVYFPLAQAYTPLATLIVEADTDPAGLGGAFRSRVRDVAPELTVHSVRTLERQVMSVLAPERAGATLVAGFGGVGLLLAAVGLYGVIAAGVARRTREIGVRMALGADTREVRRMVVGRGMALVAVGALVGIPLALALGRLVEGFLFRVGAVDATTYLAAPAMLAAVALIACYLPARRATLVDPVEAIRNE